VNTAVPARLDRLQANREHVPRLLDLENGLRFPAEDVDELGRAERDDAS
jgi:hypothetical protein